MKARCTRNTSSALPYSVGLIYGVATLGGGMYEFRDGQGSAIIAPLKGHYVDFEIIEETKK
jgi:hypothetical protein